MCCGDAVDILFYCCLHVLFNWHEHGGCPFQCQGSGPFQCQGSGPSDVSDAMVMDVILTAVGGGVQTDFEGEQRPEVSAAA